MDKMTWIILIMWLILISLMILNIAVTTLSLLI